MKRARIMLTVIAVLAGVGGALAFNANNMRLIKFCVAKINQTCTITVTRKVGGTIQVDATTFPAGVTKCTLADNGFGALCPQKLNLTLE